MRKAVALAAVATATFAGGAQAGPVGSGAGTGIMDWLAVYQDVGNGHSARSYCEYATDPGPYGHFEAGTEAMTGGTFNGSTDVTSLDVSCTFYGTPTGTVTLTRTTGTTPAARSYDQTPAGRPTKVCLTANVHWTNGDVFSVVNKCQAGRVHAWRDDIAVAVGIDERTDGTIDNVTGTAVDCTATAASVTECTNRVKGLARTVSSISGSPYQPGVEVSIQTAPGTG
jgi:hypothetical protein